MIEILAKYGSLQKRVKIPHRPMKGDWLHIAPVYRQVNYVRMTASDPIMIVALETSADESEFLHDETPQKTQWIERLKKEGWENLS